MNSAIYVARVTIDFVGYDPIITDRDELLNKILDAIHKTKMNASVTCDYSRGVAKEIEA